MRIFKNKPASAAEDSAFAERLSAIASRGRDDLCPGAIVPETSAAPKAIPQRFWTPAELLAESAGE
jgi:hypothetical protein